MKIVQHNLNELQKEGSPASSESSPISTQSPVLPNGSLSNQKMLPVPHYNYTMPSHSIVGQKLRWFREHPYYGTLVGVGIITIALGFIFCGSSIALAAVGIALGGQGLLLTGGWIIGMTVLVTVILLALNSFFGNQRAAISLIPLLYFGISIASGFLAGGIAMCIIASILGAFGTVAFCVGLLVGIAGGILVANGAYRFYQEARQEVKEWQPADNALQLRESQGKSLVIGNKKAMS